MRELLSFVEVDDKGRPDQLLFSNVTVIYSAVETRSTLSPVPSTFDVAQHLKSCLSALPVKIVVITISQHRLVISVMQ